MKTYSFGLLTVLLFFSTQANAQKNQSANPETQIQVTYAEYLGKTPPLRELTPLHPASSEKRAKSKTNRKTVKNFIGREKYQPLNPEALPLGPDAIRQSTFNTSFNTVVPIEPLFNFEGMDENDFDDSPPDPTLDVGNNYVIQMINATLLQIWDKAGNEITQPIAANTIWNQIGFSSAGDPIILYDQEADRWIITEFPNGNQLLFAITETNDPLGSWLAWNFATPEFPDYPKYSIWSNAYCVTTNEGSPASLPSYFIDRMAILNGDPSVAIQRISLPGVGSGPGFQVATPADWSGLTPPNDAGPILLSLHDDAWGGSSDDKINIHTIDLDWDNPNNSSVNSTPIITSPFDTNPCSSGGSPFSCIPQLGGDGIDGLPAVIMNQVHYRNFNTHEALVLNFITDASGSNLSGIRWIELRRTGNQDWTLYQEGTFAPNDGLHRFMGAICMDGSGNIGLAYNVSGPNSYPGLRFTGRTATDPLGIMTIDEYILAEGENTLPEARFGDYNHMSIDPTNDRTFWFTGEYTTGGGWSTRIAAFEIKGDSVDLGPIDLVTPQSSSDLSNNEIVNIQIKNFGLDTQMVYDIGYIFEGNPVIMETANFTLPPDSTYTHTFGTTVDMLAVGDYDFKIFTAVPADIVPLNDTLRVTVSKLPRFDAGIASIEGIDISNCGTTLPIELLLVNYGTEVLNNVTINIELNGDVLTPIEWTGSLASGASMSINYTLENIVSGSNTLNANTTLPNDEIDQVMINDGISRTFEAITDGVILTLALLTDDYPQEITWELSNINGMIIYTGGPYTQESTSIQEAFCLDPELCYTFTIFDAENDGICCDNGQGNYAMTDQEGNILFSSNGEYGSSEINNFCATFECFLTAELTILPESEEGSMDGGILIIPQSGDGPFQFSIDGGLTFQSNNIFTSLPGGVYEIVVSDGSSCVYEETITISTCALDIMAEVINESAPGAGDGQVTISTSNGMDPLQYSIDNGGTFQNSPIFTDLPADTYVIIVEDVNGCRSELEIIIDAEVPTIDLHIGYLIEIMPNPTEGVASINVKGPNQVSVFLKYHVYDTKGRLIQVSQLTRYDDTFTGQLSLVSYPSGTYFIRFLNTDIKRMLRLVKQ